MQRFLIKISIFTVLFVVVNILLLFLVPKDRNSYLSEYSRKVEILDTTSQPRVIFIGGSNIPFGINSQAIGDSLHCHVVDFGLHGGIGARYLLDDCLSYIKKGDTVVLQLEYEHFYNGGNGESYLLFMLANNWRNYGLLNFDQWKCIISETPTEAIANIRRLRKSITKHTFDTPASDKKFEYAKSGFNIWGDEVSHLQFPGSYTQPEVPESKVVDTKFVDWLAETIHLYNRHGVKVLLLPPVCVESQFKASYNEDIARELNRVHLIYITDPTSMVLPDSCAFNTGYHINRKGVEQNTRRIIALLSQTYNNK